MKENTYNFWKGAKLHLCCSDNDFRPAMNNIYFDEGHAIATDGHILICVDVHDISNLNDEDIERLNGKLLNSASYKELLKYPNYKSVLDDIVVPEKKEEQVPKTFNTGLNIKSLKRLTDAVSTNLVDLRYTSRHGAIQVIFSQGSLSGTRAIIMPRIPQCEQ